MSNTLMAGTSPAMTPSEPQQVPDPDFELTQPTAALKEPNKILPKSKTCAIRIPIGGICFALGASRAGGERPRLFETVPVYNPPRESGAEGIFYLNRA
jgi:hypothetical protein